MKIRLLLFCLCSFATTYFSQDAFGQKKQFLLSGTVKDAETGSPLENTSILFSGMTVGVSTDSLGYFSILLPPKSYQIVVRTLGYKIRIERFSLSQNLNFDFLLEKVPRLLDEVVITAEKADANVNRTIMGVEKISGKTLKKLPNLMGEADVIRSIMLLPGVSTVGEGASGFNVRGGNVDQNLVLLDGIPLFNTSHLFGFFTGFNADMVQDVSLFKGGIPSMYGGRASSVLDVRLKEGNFDKWSLQGGVGPISSRLLVEGPIFKGKTSIIVGARASLSDFYLKYFNNPALKQSKANFYDINAKITHKFGKNQRISLAAYTSDDAFKFAQDTLYSWNTRNVSLKHNALIGNKISHNLTVFLSKYQYGITGLKPQFEYKWQPSIIQKSIREDLSYEVSNKSRIDFGGDFSLYRNDAGSLLPNAPQSIIEAFKMPVQQSREMSVYAGHSLTLSPKISIDYGLRYAFYQLVGPDNVYNYQLGKPREIETITDTLTYKKGSVIKSYGGFEPRFSFAFKIDSSFSVKLGFNRMQQFMHLLSNTMAISPADIWKNSNAQLPQQIADQFSIGVFKNFNNAQNSTFETSVEVYYKNLKNVIDYVDGAALYLNPTVETQLLVGKGYAYGAEFFIKKARGKKLTGWLSYTYSRTFRQIEANENQVGANFGLRFPANFDSPHNIKFVLNNRWSKRITFNANFTYNTGRPITYPNGRYKIYAYNDVYDYMVAKGLNPRQGLDKRSYVYNGQTYVFLENATIIENLDGYASPSFTLRNAERIPDYFRLDVGLTLDPKEKSKMNSSWNFSIYNILNRQNVYSIYFRSSTGLRNLARTYKLSVLGAAIPSLTYNFKF
ncbi:TonB-dependent receptor [Emticicia sp. SJ17W-69]|uniref:TonB-dependent receptor n=1 Tax=Emticicia sp. SJ17W-69 TaxID=3421657 RepID=UPI003EB8117E